MYADRVKDATSSTGTGAITLLNAAPTGYQTFATAFGASPVLVSYCIADQTGSNWEVGTGTFNGTTGLTRTTILASSNAGSPVDFTAGTKDVFCTAPARYLEVAGANTQVQYNNAGVFGANANFTYVAGTNTISFGNITGSGLSMLVQTKAPTATDDVTFNYLDFFGRSAAKSNTSGQTIRFVSGAGNGTGNGGGVNFGGGNSTSGIGGGISLTTGSGTSGGSFVASLGGGSTGTGGGFTLTAGACLTGTGGSILFTGGSGTLGGSIQLQVGASSSVSGAFGRFETSGPLQSAGIYNNNFGQYTIECSDDDTNGVTIGFFGAAPAIQQNTAIATITRTAVAGGNAVDDNDKFGGYTIGQIVTALKAYGLLA